MNAPVSYWIGVAAGAVSTALLIWAISCIKAMLRDAPNEPEDKPDPPDLPTAGG